MPHEPKIHVALLKETWLGANAYLLIEAGENITDLNVSAAGMAGRTRQEKAAFISFAAAALTQAAAKFSEQVNEPTPGDIRRSVTGGPCGPGT